MPVVSASKVIYATVSDVWNVIRDFGSHDRWIEHNPEITLEGGNGLTIGVKRRVAYADGSFFDEILTGMDDRNWLQEYAVVGDLPLPVYNVFGAMQLYPISTESATLAVRRLSYDTPLSEAEAQTFAGSRVTLLESSLDLLAELFR